MEKPVTNIQVLSYRQHSHLKVITGYADEFGDNVESLLTFVNELGDMQREYPLVFRKDSDTGEFGLIALLGLEPNENLFIQQNQWCARYVPFAIKRGPFIVGYQDQSSMGGSSQEPVIYVDLNNPKINEDQNNSQGEAVFSSDGKISEYMQQVNQSLLAIHQGMEFNQKMISLFKELDLIESVNLDIELNNGQKIQLQGNYTINQQKLSSLDGEALQRLNQSGFLQAAFLIMGSLSNIQYLVNLKNAQVK